MNSTTNFFKSKQMSIFSALDHTALLKIHFKERFIDYTNLEHMSNFFDYDAKLWVYDSQCKPRKYTAEAKTAGYYNRLRYILGKKCLSLEAVSNVEENRIGNSMINCKADLWIQFAFVDEAEREDIEFINIFDWRKFALFFKENYKNYPENPSKTKNEKTGKITTTDNRFVPLEDLENFKWSGL